MSKKTKTSKSKRSSSVKAKNLTEVKTRRIRLPKYRPLRKKQIKPVRPDLPNAFRIFGRSIMVLKNNFTLFLSILVVYVILQIILVHGFSFNGDLNQLKSAIDKANANSSSLSTGFALFTYLIGNSGSASGNASAGAYQTILLVVVSLAVIWALREVYSGAKIRMRDSFYRGMGPLVPFVLVIIVIGLQLLPLIIGGFLYNIAVSGGIASTAGQRVLWALLFFLLSTVSLYMVCSSLFALYISTLPDMTPMKALRSARQLVRFRRFAVIRKVLFLLIAIIVLFLVIMLPIVLILTPLAGWLFFVATLALLPIVHSYMYALYRELLNE